MLKLTCTSQKKKRYMSHKEMQNHLLNLTKKKTQIGGKKKRKKILVKGLMLIDRFLKSGAGSVGGSNAGAKGLGIDYATPVESPLGPTNLHDEDNARL